MIKLLDKDLKEFLKHSKNYISASFFLKGLALVSITVITYLLSPQDYGKVGVFTSLTNIFVILLSLNTFTSIVRYYHEPEKKIFDFIWTITLFLIPFLIIISPVLFYVLKLSFLEYFKISDDILLGSIIAAALYIFTRFYLSYLQTSQQSKIYNTVSTLRGFILLFLTLSLYYLLPEDKYHGRIFAEVLVNLVLVFIILNIFLKSSKIKFNLPLLSYSLAYSIPLIPHALSAVFLNSSDRIILNQLRGAEETGYYTFAYQIGLVLEIVILGTNKSWVPMFFNKLKEKKYLDIENLAIKYKKMIFLLAVFFILYSEDGVKLLANKSYHNSLDVIPIILISYCFMFIYTIYGNYALYNKKTYLIAINTIVAGTLNIVLNYLFIPRYGYMAAGLSTLFSFFILMMLYYLSIRYILSIQSIIILKLFKDFQWVLGAYAVVLFGNFIQDKILLFQFIKVFFLAFTVWAIYPRLFRSNLSR